jgi:DNA invertase Pin-like site-specific DNA recombinase
MGRDGLVRLLDQVREKSFEVVIVEALDRLSRDMEDLAGIRKRLSFLGIDIWAVHDGVVNTVLVGLRGLVGQLCRKDNAHKVRRGQAGRVSCKGLAGGSLAHGYAAVAGKNGERVIVNVEAEVVRRIFPDYVEGRTPREIAHDLNKERVPPPLGRAWNASTINGNRQRCAGILQDELYVGRLVRNKVRMVKDPDTGKRQSRPNSTSDWQFAEVPSLAIVSPDLFEAAQKADGSELIRTPVISVVHAGCCLDCFVAVRVVRACRRMGKTSRDGFGFVARQQRRAVSAPMLRRFTWTQWRGSARWIESQVARTEGHCRVRADVSRRKKATCGFIERKTAATGTTARSVEPRD